MLKMFFFKGNIKLISQINEKKIKDINENFLKTKKILVSS